MRRSLARLGFAFALLAFAPACGGATPEETVNDTTPDPEPEPEPTAPKLGLNDVSVLVPVPASPDTPGYLTPLSAGAKGELLPQAVYDEIPDFPVTPSQGLNYERMRVVALRFDGCNLKPSGCEAQLRLVMQPVTSGGKMRDSALHLFYSLTDQELAELVPELRRLRGLAPELADAPLDVHAGLVAQGMQGAYGTALSELVLSIAGEQNLTRMTFFLRAPPSNEVWFFGGFERASGELTVMDIEGVGMGNQQVLRTEIDAGYDFTVNPTASVPKTERTLLTSAAAAAATEEERAAAFAAFLQVQNPRKFSADELSCAGCHLGTFVLEQTSATHGLSVSDFPEDAFSSSWDLSLRGGASQKASSLRAFGYFDAEPMIAQRVVNESAEVVDDLEKRFPAK